eukprot:15366330-Ditylum_brightwellii.AAC.1
MTSIASIVVGFVIRFGFLTGVPDLTFILAMSAIGAFVISIILQLYANLVLLYKLEPSAAKDVCRSFWGTLLQKYADFNIGRSDKSIASPALEDRESWEYVAREFLTETRFDTVLGANRFNAVMQAIQSGDSDSWRGNKVFTKSE